MHTHMHTHASLKKQTQKKKKKEAEKKGSVHKDFPSDDFVYIRRHILL
jgi:hypothetical protein